MKKILVLLLLLLSTSAFASFEDVGTGARATGLGGAFTPIADDVHSIYYNPAGLVYLRRKELSASYGLLNTGLSDGSRLTNSFVAYGHPLSRDLGTFGLSYQQLSQQDLYSERTISVGYGRQLSSRFAAGLNLKQLYRQYTSPTGATDNFGFIDTTKSDPVFASGNSKSNIGADLGVLWRPYRNYSYGLEIQNINEPNMAIADNDSDVIPMTIRAGLAYNERTLTLAGELDTKRNPSGLGRDFNFTTAGEKWWQGAGFAQADLGFRGSLAFGSRDYSQVTMGLSYRLDSVQLDYGFLMPLSGVSFGTSQGTHRFTFTLRFGKTVVEYDYELRMKAAEVEARKAEEELDQARKESERLAQELSKLKEEMEKKKTEIEQTRQRSGREAAVKETASRFAEEMDKYWRRKSQGANLQERIETLSQIIKEFSGSGIDTSVAEKELAVAKSDRAKSEVDLAVSWSYYQKIVARGASVPERIQILSQMIERFAHTGVDITNIRDELKALKEHR